MEENQAEIQNQQPEEQKQPKKTVFTREYYQRIGRKGGQARVPKGFSANPKLASEAGKIGGKISRPYTQNPKKGKKNATK